MAANQSDNVQFVVKRTFIELNEQPQVPYGRARASSDSALDSFQERSDFFCSSFEVTKLDSTDLSGLSDMDTAFDSERVDTAFSACSEIERYVSSYSVATSTSTSMVQSSGAPSRCASSGSVVRVDSGVSLAASADADSFSPRCSAEKVSQFLVPCEAAVEEEHQDQDTRGNGLSARLRRENDRLKEENKLLRQSDELPTKNAELRVSLCPTPSPSAATAPHALVALPMPVWFSNMPQDGAAPQGVMPMSIWIGSPSCSQAWSSPSEQHERPSKQSNRWKREKGSKNGEASQLGATLPSNLSHNSPSNTEVEGCTTVMLRNLPNNYTRAMVISMLNKEGFSRKFDFLYLPIDFKTRACLGYAFVNLVHQSLVPQFWNKFDGFTRWVLPSRKVCCVTWSGPHQGLEAHMNRYRDSPVMHSSVPEEFRPVMFKDGVKTPLPAPTRAPRAPRTRNYSSV